MNSQFDFFALTNFFSVSICSLLCIPYSSLCFFSFQFVYFSYTTTIPKLVLAHCKHHPLFRSWHNATTKFNHHNIHNSFGNSFIQSVHQPSVYSRLNESKFIKCTISTFSKFTIFLFSHCQEITPFLNKYFGKCSLQSFFKGNKRKITCVSSKPSIFIFYYSLLM